MSTNITLKEVKEIENLNYGSIYKYTENMTEEKKEIVFSIFRKEIAKRQWKTIATEKHI